MPLCARNTLLRTIRSTLQLEDWAKLLKDVKAKDLTCKEYTDIFISQDQRAGVLQLQEALEQNDSKLHDILDLLRSSQEDNLRVLIANHCRMIMRTGSVKHQGNG